MKSTVLWVRHAKTHTKALIGWTDIDADLSDQSTIKWLQGRIPENALIISSDLKRASATADAITQNRCRLPDHKGLREINFGLWEGKTADEVSQSHPEESRLFWSNPMSARPPNGESWQELTHRAAAVIDQIINDHPNQTIVLVSHFGTILSQASRADNADRHDLHIKHIQNLSMTEMSHENGKWKLVAFNELPQPDESTSI